MKNEKKETNGNTKRAPVVAIMGHIDHGKSTLLDYIRKANVVASEAGGITQHLGAYEVFHKGSDGKEHPITFLDTPGHEAFSGIRSRGAGAADIAILVVSGEEGVKPQTIEALNSIKKTEVPYIIAITKIDSPKTDIEKIKGNLAENEIYVEGYGGQLPWVGVSGKTGQGVEELLDLILLSADIAELQGNRNIPGEGLVIEAHVDNKKGISAVLLVKNGTLKKGMTIVAGEAIVSLRYIENFKGERIEEASFSSPVRATGWSMLPKVGSAFKSFKDKKEAAEYAFSQKPGSLKQAIKAEVKNKVILNLIIKADAAGSLEALQQEIKKIDTEKVHVEIIEGGIGEISLNDVKRTEGLSNSYVVGFNVKIDSQAKHQSEMHGKEIKTFSIIYKLIEWLQEEIKEKTPKEEVQEVRGKAKILKVFSKNKDKQIVGGRVEEGSIFLGEDVRILRRDAEIAQGKIRELQQQKNKASEAKKDTEFGAMILCSTEIAPGDKIEGYKIIDK